MGQSRTCSVNLGTNEEWLLLLGLFELAADLPAAMLLQRPNDANSERAHPPRQCAIGPGGARNQMAPAHADAAAQQAFFQRQQGLRTAGLAVACTAADELAVDAGRAIALARHDVQAAERDYLNALYDFQINLATLEAASGQRLRPTPTVED